MIRSIACCLALLVAACAREAPPSQVEAPDRLEAVSAADLPADVAAAARAALPGFSIVAAERKERDGRVYYDVEGVRAGGAEAELDLLQTAEGWRVVEIQRDIIWGDAPAPVRDLVATSPRAFLPVRVIESTQAESGEVIYELFAEGRPESPSLEVRVVGDRAEFLTEANPH